MARNTAIDAAFSLVIFGVLTSIPAGADAQESGRLVGSVVSAARSAPLAGATVEVPGSALRTFTNRNGRFRLGRVPAGRTEVTVTLLGHSAWTGAVVVEAGGIAVLEVTLDEAPIAVDPVVVLLDRTRLLGDLAAVPGAAQRVTRQDLQAQGSTFDNVHDALRFVPGVNIQEEDGYGLRPNIGLRGTGVERSSKITVMEDGVLAAPAPYAAPAAYYFPVTGRMEAIEVRKGSSQVKYGPRTIGGALNLVSSRVPDRTGWGLDVAGGENSTFKARGRVGGASDRVGWLLETYQIGTNGFKDLVGGADTGYRVGDYLGKLRVSTDRDAPLYQELELKVGYTDQVSNETYLGLTDADFRVSPLLRYPASGPDVMDAQHRLLQARWFLRPSDRFDITATAYRNDFRRNWYKLQSVLGTGISSVLDDPAGNAEALAILRGESSEDDALEVRANNREYYSQGVQVAVGLNFGGAGAHAIEIGARLHQDEEDRFQFEDGYRMERGEMVRTSRGAPGSQSNRVSDARAVSLYVQDDVRLGSWTLSPGLRYESVDFTRTDYGSDDPDRTDPTRVRASAVTALIPGFAAAFEIRPSAHVFGGVHRGFGPPGPGADPDTRAEESINYELGMRLRRAGLAGEATFFVSDYRNILGTETLATGETGDGDQFNGGAADVGGVELSASYDPTHGRGLAFGVPIRASYTFTSAEFRSSFESDYDPWGDVVTGDEFPYLPKHQFSASVGLEGLEWGATLSAFGASAMRTEAGQGDTPPSESTDSYVVLSLVAERGLSWNGTLYLGIQNLLDESYIVARRPAGARPGLPRTLMAGFRIER